MSVVIEILDGPQAGQQLQATQFAYLNWKWDKIELEDEAQEGSSAEILKNSNGVYYLQSSSDRLNFEINASSVKKIHLIPGVYFRLNGVSLRVKAFADDFIAASPSPAKPPSLPSQFKTEGPPTLEGLRSQKKPRNKKPAGDKPKLVVGKKSWKNFLAEFFENFQIQSSAPSEIQIFNPAIELEFVQGLLLDKKLALFFGPRTAGFGHLDLDLEDPESPDVAFEIHPTPQGPEIVNLSGFKVLLNKKSFDRQILKPGDFLEIGHSVIKINQLDIS